MRNPTKPLTALAALTALLTGCTAWTSRPPIEETLKSVMTDVIAPAVKTALKADTNRSAIAAGAQGINPTYAIEFDGLWVTGIHGRCTIGVEGVAGQISVNTVLTPTLTEAKP